MKTSWRTIRLFISSTFLDMHAERDILESIVFPSLRERLLPYHIYLDTIDLRWGITEAQSSEHLTLELCLDRIDDARPYFLGIIGDRYGSPVNTIRPETLNRHPWLAQYLGRSITELEFRYGLTAADDQELKAVVMLRDPLDTTGLSVAINQYVFGPVASDKKPMSDLRRWVLDTLTSDKIGTYNARFAGVRDNRQLKDATGPAAGTLFTAEALTMMHEEEQFRLLDNGTFYLSGLETFASETEEHLWSLIRQDLDNTPGISSPAVVDVFDEDEEINGRFVELRTRNFFGQEKILDALLAVIYAGDGLPVLLTGDEGSGKTALIATLSKHLEDRAGTFTLSHFCGTSGPAAQTVFLLRKLCTILIHHFQFTRASTSRTEQEPIQPESILMKLIPQLHDLLSRIPATEKVVILLDGLDELDTAGHADFLNWLPKKLPPQVSLIVTGISAGSANHWVAQFFERHHCHQFALRPLADDARIKIAGMHSSFSGRQLSDLQLQSLIALPGTGNPLFLYIALEELRHFHSAQQLSARIETLPTGEGAIDEVIGQFFRRLESDFDALLVADIISLLSSARKGLSERELLELGTANFTALTPGHFYALLRQLRSYLQYKGELMSFFHPSFSRVAVDRYLSTDALQRSVHQRLAGFFETQTDRANSYDPLAASLAIKDVATLNKRKLEELPWQLLRYAGLVPPDYEVLQERLFTLFTNILFLEERLFVGYDELLGDFSLCISFFEKASDKRSILNATVILLTVHRNRLEKYPAGLAMCLYQNFAQTGLLASAINLWEKILLAQLRLSSRPFFFPLHLQQQQQYMEKLPFDGVPHCGHYMRTGQVIGADYYKLMIWDREGSIKEFYYPEPKLPRIMLEDSDTSVLLCFWAGNDTEPKSRETRIVRMDIENGSITELIRIVDGTWLIAMARLENGVLCGVTTDGIVLEIYPDTRQLTGIISLGCKIKAAFIGTNGAVTYIPKGKDRDLQTEKKGPISEMTYFAPTEIRKWEKNSHVILGSHVNPMESLVKAFEDSNYRDMIGDFDHIITLDRDRVLLVSSLKILCFFPATQEFFCIYKHYSHIQAIYAIDEMTLLLIGANSVILNLRQVPEEPAESKLFDGREIDAICAMPDDQLLASTSGAIQVYDPVTRKSSSLMNVHALTGIRKLGLLRDGTMILRPQNRFQLPQLLYFDNTASKLEDLTNIVISRNGVLWITRFIENSHKYLLLRYRAWRNLFVEMGNVPINSSEMCLRSDGWFVTTVSEDNKDWLGLWKPGAALRKLVELPAPVFLMDLLSTNELVTCDLEGNMLIWDIEYRCAHVYFLDGFPRDICCHWKLPMVTIWTATGELVTLHNGHSDPNLARGRWSLPLLTTQSWRMQLMLVAVQQVIVLIILKIMQIHEQNWLEIEWLYFFIGIIPVLLILISAGRKPFLVRLKIIRNRKRQAPAEKVAPDSAINPDPFRRWPLKVGFKALNDQEIASAILANTTQDNWFMRLLKRRPILLCLFLFVVSNDLPVWADWMFIVLLASVAVKMILANFRFLPDAAQPWVMPAKWRLISSVLPSQQKRVLDMKAADHRQFWYGLSALTFISLFLILRFWQMIQTIDFRFIYLMLLAIILLCRLLFSDSQKNFNRPMLAGSRWVANHILAIGIRESDLKQTL